MFAGFPPNKGQPLTTFGLMEALTQMQREQEVSERLFPHRMLRAHA